MVCLLAEAHLGDDYSLWILAQTSMSQMTVQQSYLLCWVSLPDRNRKSMGLWYWELMSHPDPALLPVGTLHSLEWFWVSRRIFVYSHHNTIVFFSKTSVRLKPEIPSFHLYMGPLVHPTNRDCFKAWSSVRPERFPDICQRTHGGNGLKFCMLMYLVLSYIYHVKWM